MRFSARGVALLLLCACLLPALPSASSVAHVDTPAVATLEPVERPRSKKKKQKGAVRSPDAVIVTATPGSMRPPADVIIVTTASPLAKMDAAVGEELPAPVITDGGIPMEVVAHSTGHLTDAVSIENQTSNSTAISHPSHVSDTPAPVDLPAATAKEPFLESATDAGDSAASVGGGAAVEPHTTTAEVEVLDGDALNPTPEALAQRRTHSITRGVVMFGYSKDQSADSAVENTTAAHAIDQMVSDTTVGVAEEEASAASVALSVIESAVGLNRSLEADGGSPAATAGVSSDMGEASGGPSAPSSDVEIEDVAFAVDADGSVSVADAGLSFDDVGNDTIGLFVTGTAEPLSTDFGGEVIAVAATDDSTTPTTPPCVTAEGCDSASTTPPCVAAEGSAAHATDSTGDYLAASVPDTEDSGEAATLAMEGSGVAADGAVIAPLEYDDIATTVESVESDVIATAPSDIDSEESDVSAVPFFNKESESDAVVATPSDMEGSTPTHIHVTEHHSGSTDVDYDEAVLAAPHPNDAYTVQSSSIDYSEVEGVPELSAAASPSALDSESITVDHAASDAATATATATETEAHPLATSTSVASTADAEAYPPAASAATTADAEEAVAPMATAPTVQSIDEVATDVAAGTAIGAPPLALPTSISTIATATSTTAAAAATSLPLTSPNSDAADSAIGSTSPSDAGPAPAVAGSSLGSSFASAYATVSSKLEVLRRDAVQNSVAIFWLSLFGAVHVLVLITLFWVPRVVIDYFEHLGKWQIWAWEIVVLIGLCVGSYFFMLRLEWWAGVAGTALVAVLLSRA